MDQAPGTKDRQPNREPRSGQTCLLLTNMGAALLPLVAIGTPAEEADDPDRYCDSPTLSALSVPKDRHAPVH